MSHKTNVKAKTNPNLIYGELGKTTSNNTVSNPTNPNPNPTIDEAGKWKEVIGWATYSRIWNNVFGTDRKLIYKFHLLSCLIICQIFASESECLTLSLSLGVIPC